MGTVFWIPWILFSFWWFWLHNTPSSQNVECEFPEARIGIDIVLNYVDIRQSHFYSHCNVLSPPPHSPPTPVRPSHVEESEGQPFFPGPMRTALQRGLCLGPPQWHTVPSIHLWGMLGGTECFKHEGNKTVTHLWHGAQQTKEVCSVPGLCLGCHIWLPLT